MRRLIALCTLAIATLAACAAPDRWYVMEMQGQRAGWTVERQRTEEDGTIVTTSESELTIKRGATEIVMRMRSSFTETESGEPVEMTAFTDIGGGPTEERYVFTDEGVVWTSSAGDRKTSKTLGTPEGRWLPPAAAARFVRKRLEAKAEEITVRTIDPLNGIEPVVTTRSGFEESTIEVLGRSVSALRCETRSTLYPDTVGTEYIDDRGDVLRSELNLGAITITILAADEQLATAELDPPELMRSLFVAPDHPIDKPYAKRSAVFVVRATEGTLPELPSVGSQSVEPISESAVRVRRSLDTHGSQATEAERTPHLAPTAMITCDDPRVMELTETALAAAPDDPRERAETARRFVHRHIRTKDLSVGFASAAETARTREGDCTEHAVLLAAILRADGIPSRVVSGLIYADRFAGGRDIFGYHMWTQAMLPDPENPEGDPIWVDLDATLPTGLPMTATHVALGTHALEGDSRANALVELAPLMGRLAIEVESVE